MWYSSLLLGNSGQQKVNETEQVVVNVGAVFVSSCNPHQDLGNWRRWDLTRVPTRCVKRDLVTRTTSRADFECMQVYYVIIITDKKGCGYMATATITGTSWCGVVKVSYEEWLETCADHSSSSQRWSLESRSPETLSNATSQKIQMHKIPRATSWSSGLIS